MKDYILILEKQLGLARRTSQAGDRDRYWMSGIKHCLQTKMQNECDETERLVGRFMTHVEYSKEKINFKTVSVII